MRFKTFSAPTLTQAMGLVRRELGDDAAIISTGNNRETGEVVIVAAHHVPPDDPRSGRVPQAPEDRREQVLSTLVLHGVPLSLADRLGQAAGRMETQAPMTALAGALELDFTFAPLDVRDSSPRLIMVGPPGTGKTLALVKLATQAVLAGRSVQILTTDLKRAGAVEQLTAFSRILGVEVFITETADELAQYVARIPKRTMVLVDTPGTNHRSATELDDLIDFVRAAPVEPVLVMNAGMDALDAADTAMAFSAVGARRMLFSRIDVSGRLGAILAAMEAAAIALAGTTGSPEAADPFVPASAAGLAEILFDEALRLSADLPERGAEREQAEQALTQSLEDEINVALPPVG